jgi:hypothetical protein
VTKNASSDKPFSFSFPVAPIPGGQRIDPSLFWSGGQTTVFDPPLFAVLVSMTLSNLIR